MYRVHYLEQTDKMSQQVHLRMLEEVYSRELLLACVQQSPKRQQKRRRLRHFTVLSVLWFLLAMVLWSRLSQGRVWDKLTHWLQDRFPQEPAGASAVSYQRAILGAEPLQWLFEHGTHVLCTPETAGAFYRGYRLMALDGSLFNVPDTQANAQAFGRSCNQYGKGAYPQARAVMLTECGSHATVGLHLGDYDEAEIHGAYALLPKREPGHVADARCQLLWRRLSRSAQCQRGACAVRSAQHSRAGAGAQSARWQLPGTAYAAEAGRLSDAAATLATCHRVSGKLRASGRAWPRVSDRHYLA